MLNWTVTLDPFFMQVAGLHTTTSEPHVHTLNVFFSQRFPKEIKIVFRESQSNCIICWFLKPNFGLWHQLVSGDNVCVAGNFKNSIDPVSVLPIE